MKRVMIIVGQECTATQIDAAKLRMTLMNHFNISDHYDGGDPERQLETLCQKWPNPARSLGRCSSAQSVLYNVDGRTTCRGDSPGCFCHPGTDLTAPSALIWVTSSVLVKMMMPWNCTVSHF